MKFGGAILVVLLGVACAWGTEPFRVSRSSPADGARDVPTDAAVQIHFSERFDAKSIDQQIAQLWLGKQRVEARVGSDLGGVVTLSPEAPLAPEQEYRIVVSNRLRSLTGEALAPFEARFRTGQASAVTATLPPFRKEAVGRSPGMTALVFAKDWLYAITWEGSLLRWPVDAATGRLVGDPETLFRDPKLRLTALCQDPAEPRHLWLACDDNAGASTCELRFTARIVRLTLPEAKGDPPGWQDVITGLPIGDHAIGGLRFGPDGRLYFTSNGITMLGGEKKNSRETPLSAAVLVADVRSPAFARARLPINVDTSSDPPYDPAAKEAPVRVFATGIREAYGLCWHSNGALYAGINQNDTGEWTPSRPDLKLPAVSARPDEPLIRIVEGKYYGHPNPSRRQWVLLGGNPTAGRDPWEVPELPVGTTPEPGFDPTLLIYNLVPIGGQSANGCEEFQGDGPLRRRLIICFYTSARTLHTFAFSRDGTKVIAEEPLRDGEHKPLKFGAPLDLAIDHHRGRLYVADFADTRRGDSAQEGVIWLVSPANEP